MLSRVRVLPLRPERSDFMFLYSKRLDLIKKFNKWCEQNGTSRGEYNFLCFLQDKKLLNEDEAMKFVEEEE